MRSLILTTVAAIGLAAASVHADMTKETTTSTTTYSGTVSSVMPSNSTIVVKSESAPEPSEYTYNEKTMWVDSSGNTVTREAVKNQPVTIHYEKQGDQTVVTKVVSQKTVSAPAPAPVIEKKTTTTTTTEPGE